MKFRFQSIRHRHQTLHIRGIPEPQLRTNGIALIINDPPLAECFCFCRTIQSSARVTPRGDHLFHFTGVSF